MNKIAFDITNKQEATEIMEIIIATHNLSITEIVSIKENSINEEKKKLTILVNGLAFRSTAMFGTDKEIVEKCKQIRPLVINDINESGIMKGTTFGKEYLK